MTTFNEKELQTIFAEVEGREHKVGYYTPMHLNTKPAKLSDDESQYGMVFTEVMNFVDKESSRNKKNLYDPSELESYLMIRVLNEVKKNEDLNNIKGIRRIIKLRSVDFHRKQSKRDFRVGNFTTFEGFASEQDSTPEEYVTTQVSEHSINLRFSQKDIVDQIVMNDFLATLKEDEKELLELLEKQYRVGEVAKVLGIHRNSVQNKLKGLREKALDFGYWELSDAHNVDGGDFIKGSYTKLTSIPTVYDVEEYGLNAPTFEFNHYGSTTINSPYKELPSPRN